jgi:hypothetical protein
MTCTGQAAFGQNVSRLYPQEKLQVDAARWSEQIQAEYRDTILPQLTDEERSAIGAVKIEVPLAGPNGDPFSFYTDNKGTIHLPALSLRFFSDLCVANAWLNAHGYDGTTVRDYVGLLFREATASPRAPLPAVFGALGVPDNAREESAVAKRADRNFGNTIVFLLVHELGHALKKHRTDLRDPVEQRKQEIEADAFAIEIMRRIGQLPTGIEFWFDVEHSGHVAPVKFDTEAAWQKYLTGLDHPVTTGRLEALAAAIEKAPDSFARNRTIRLSGLSVRRCWRSIFASAHHDGPPIRLRTRQTMNASTACTCRISSRAKQPLPFLALRTNRSSTDCSPCAEPLRPVGKTKWTYYCYAWERT